MTKSTLKSFNKLIIQIRNKKQADKTFKTTYSFKDILNTENLKNCIKFISDDQDVEITKIKFHNQWHGKEFVNSIIS